MSELQSILIPYEQRSQQQHSIVVSFIMKIIPNIDTAFARLLSFFMSYYHDADDIQQSNFSKQTLVFVIEDKTSQFLKVKQIIVQKGCLNMYNGKSLLMIQECNISKCNKLTTSTIQQQIKFLRDLQYFSEINKKRIYHMLKQLSLAKYSFEQRVYHEGDVQEITQRGIYIVRKGQFCFMKKQAKSHKNIQLFTFTEGYIFGIQQQESSPIKTDREPLSRQSSPLLCANPRQFTVKCKSSQALCYRCPYDFFQNYLKSSCEYILKKNKRVLNKFMNKKIQNSVQNPIMQSNFFLTGNKDSSHPKQVSIPQQVLNQYSQIQSKFNLTKRSFSQLNLLKQKQRSAQIQKERQRQIQRQKQFQIQKQKKQKSLQLIKKQGINYKSKWFSRTITKGQMQKAKQKKLLGQQSIVASKQLIKKRESLPKIGSIFNFASLKTANPQYQQQLKIINKKQKFMKIREIIQPTSTKLTKGEILFSLMKHSWHFQKNKYKSIM